MNTDRLQYEYRLLAQKYELSWHRDHQGIVIHDFNYPTGWHPSPAPLLVRLPDTWPRMQPAAYIPSRLRYTQGFVAHRMACDLNGWHRWCTHRVPWTPNKSLPEFLQLIMASLSKPGEKNPYMNVRERT